VANCGGEFEGGFLCGGGGALNGQGMHFSFG